MNNPFKWLREQYTQRKALWEDKSISDRTSAEKHIGTWNKALEILDVAEKKWESDVCEWELCDVKAGVQFYKSCKGTRPYYIYDEIYCPYCSRRIKVVDKCLKDIDEYIAKLEAQPADVAKTEAIEALKRTGVIGREEE